MKFVNQELRPVSFVLRKSAENQLEKTEAAESKRYGFIAQVNYIQNEWRWKLHSKRVKMKTTFKTSEDENYTQNEWSV